jgi:hypothetical protein
MSSPTPPHYSEDGQHWWDGGRWLAVGHPQKVRRPSLAFVIPLSVVLIAISGAVLLSMALITLPALAGPAPRPGVAPPGQSTASIGDVRACSGNDFNTGDERCSRNRANQSFQTKQLACSATVSTPAAQAPDVQFTLLYDGKAVTKSSAQTKRVGSSYSAYYGFALGDVTLPGGTWGCEFALASQRKDVNFRIDGPTGSLLYASACDANDTASPNGALLCSKDQSSISGPDGIACTAIVAGALNRQIKLDVVYGAGSGQPYTHTFSGTADSQLFPASGQVGPSDVGGTGSSMPSGSYTCTWSVDGHQVGQKAFKVP